MSSMVGLVVWHTCYWNGYCDFCLLLFTYIYIYDCWHDRARNARRLFQFYLQPLHHQKSPVLPLLFNSLHPALPRPMPSRRHRHNSLKKIKSKSPERTTQLLSETKPRKFCRQERDPLPAQCRRLLPILKSCCLGARSSENQTSVTNNH
jgi:hypothetical protein